MYRKNGSCSIFVGEFLLFDRCASSGWWRNYIWHLAFCELVRLRSCVLWFSVSVIISIFTFTIYYGYLLYILGFTMTNSIFIGFSIWANEAQTTLRCKHFKLPSGGSFRNQNSVQKIIFLCVRVLCFFVYMARNLYRFCLDKFLDEKLYRVLPA